MREISRGAILLSMAATGPRQPSAARAKLAIIPVCLGQFLWARVFGHDDASIPAKAQK
jgi:hypothetical protein